MACGMKGCARPVLPGVEIPIKNGDTDILLEVCALHDGVLRNLTPEVQPEETRQKIGAILIDPPPEPEPEPEPVTEPSVDYTVPAVENDITFVRSIAVYGEGLLLVTALGIFDGEDPIGEVVMGDEGTAAVDGLLTFLNPCYELGENNSGLSLKLLYGEGIPLESVDYAANWATTA